MFPLFTKPNSPTWVSQTFCLLRSNTSCKSERLEVFSRNSKSMVKYGGFEPVYLLLPQVSICPTFWDQLCVQNESLIVSLSIRHLDWEYTSRGQLSLSVFCVSSSGPSPSNDHNDVTTPTQKSSSGESHGPEVRLPLGPPQRRE